MAGLAPQHLALSSRLSRFFSSKVRQRGSEYFFGRAATINSLTSDFLIDTVLGTNEYEVVLELDGDLLHADCSCPFAQQGELCKHIWAMILSADKRQFGKGLRVPSYIELTGFDDDADFEDFTPARPSTPRRPRSLWKQQLEMLGPRSSKTISSEQQNIERWEITYSIDGTGDRADDALSISATYVRPRPKGGMTKPQPLRIDRSEFHRLPLAEDRRLLALLIGDRGTWGWSNGRLDCSSLTISSIGIDHLLPLLCATGRLVLTKQEARSAPLRWDEGAPWRFAPRVAADDDGYRLEGFFERDGLRIPLDAPAFLQGAGLLIVENTIARFEHRGWLALVAHLRGDDPIRVPRDEGHALAEVLMSMPGAGAFELPEDLRWEEVQAVPKPIMELRRGGWPGDPFFGDVRFAYDGVEVAADDQRERIALSPRKVALRNRNAEIAAVRPLQSLGVTSSHDGWKIAPVRLFEVASLLLREGWRVESHGVRYRRSEWSQLHISSGIDWFELHGEARFDEQTVPLSDIFAALQSGEETIPLPDGSMGLLDATLRDQVELLSLAPRHGRALRFTRSQLPLVDALLAARPEISADAQIEQARAQLRHFDRVTPADPPPGFRGELRHYQKEGLGWFSFLEGFGFGGCLADDMGLGKTVQALALLERRRSGGGGGRASLAVVPRSLIFNWKDEAARFTPALRILDHTGMGRHSGTAHFNDYDLVLTTYGTLRRDAAHFAQAEFDYVILDEAQAVKNASSQTAKCVRLLRARHRLALSGTPVENHLGELWSLFEFLNPGLLGKESAFRLIRGNGSADDESRQLIARAVRPFILRRTKEQVAPELPKKVEQTLWCELEPGQRKIYDALRLEYRHSLRERIATTGVARAKIHVLEALLRLRQAACDPRLLASGSFRATSGAKIEALLAQLTEVVDEQHKALVFSQFTSMLALVREELDKRGITYAYLDGKTRNRASEVERFQNDAGIRLFLVSLKAGGQGLNLTAAEYVFLLDPWWNPAVEAQAIDRAHRIGQTRPVFAYRLVARDTVEEKILELQASKRALADAILAEDKSLIGELAAEDIELLLS